MFSQTRTVEIKGGTFTNIQNPNIYRGLDALQAAVAHTAFHNSDGRYDPPRCHARTREALLDRIIQWARREADIDKLVMWISGAAGAGKSAIEQTISEMCDMESGIILASFFFSRSDGSRNNSKSFVATIVYQMLVATPALRTEVESVLDRDPLIFNKSIDAQVVALVIRPIQILLGSGKTIPRHFLIIDGLDECMDGTRRQLIDAIWRLVSTFQSLFIVSFASRPEPDIKLAFTNCTFSSHLIRIALDDDYRADDDISLFLRDSFSEIRQTRPHIRPTWPSDGQLQTLLAKASGQFIYASTVCRFVSSPHHNPVRRLDIALGLCPANGAAPFAQLDALYSQILCSVPEECQQEGLDVVIMVHILLSAANTVDLALVSEILDLDIADIHMHLGNYGALLNVSEVVPPVDHYYGLPYATLNGDVPYTLFQVRPLHASLGDFLFDPDRSGAMYRDQHLLHELVISRMIYFLSIPWLPMVPAAVVYADWGLARHLRFTRYSSALLMRLSSIPSEALFQNLWRDGASRALGYKVYHTLLFISRQLSAVIEYLASSAHEDQPVALDNLRNFCDRLLLKALGEMSPPDRRLAVLFGSISSQKEVGSNRTLLGLMDYGSVTIFSHFKPAPQLRFFLYNLNSSHILSFFGDPSRSGIHNSLNPSEYHQMTVQCLLFLHEGLFPSAVHNLKPRRGLIRKKGFYMPMFIMYARDGKGAAEERDCPWPSHKSKDIDDDAVDGDWTQASTMGVVQGIRCAVVLLCHLLKRSPPSTRIIRLVRPPNLRRFPWVVCPEYSRKLSKVMSTYRRRFASSSAGVASRNPDVAPLNLQQLRI